MDPNTSHPAAVAGNTLAPDLLRGASQIAEFMFGTADERRTVYHLAEKARLPIFRFGAVLCARRSVLMAWIEEQEAQGKQGR